MKAIILAAGIGERLKPLTDHKPKCMIELFGKSLLQWQIENFKSFGIFDISIVTGYLGDMINISHLTYFKNAKFQTTNMVETLFCAQQKLFGSVIISYGDIIYEKNVLKKLIKSTEDFSVVVDLNWKKYWQIRFDNPLQDAESLILDNEDYIQNIGQKVNNINEIQGQYIGLIKFQNKGLEFVKEFYKKAKIEAKKGINLLNSEVPFEKSYMTDLLQSLINNAHCKIKAVTIKNGWLELDSIHDYNIYQEKYNDNTISEFINLEN